jgi:hypothetical protein
MIVIGCVASTSKSASTGLLLLLVSTVTSCELLMRSGRAGEGPDRA